MVKKVIRFSFNFLICCIFFSLFFVSNVNASDTNYSFILEKETFIKEGYDYAKYIKDDAYIYISDNSFEIVIDNKSILINDSYLDYNITNNYLYIISTSSLYKVNINLLSYEKYQTDMKIEDFVQDEYICIIGSKNENPYILVLDNDGKKLKEKYFEGRGFATFKKIEIIEDHYLVTCEKDAFFENDLFYYVGNEGDIKSAIFTFDKSLELDNSYYFNEYTIIETITSVDVFKTIKVILKTYDESYLYEFNKELSLLERNIISTDNYPVYFVSNILNEKLLLKVEPNSFSMIMNGECIYVNYKKLKSFQVIDKGIILTFDEKLNFYSEHHIESLTDLYVDKINYDCNKISDISIKSFFEELEVNYLSSNPYFETLMSGCFNVTYECINGFNTHLNFKRNVIVKDFVNIIDGGLYNINTMLSFFGRAYLNGSKINNGHIIKEEGVYNLKIVDINNEEKEYNFEVISNYYKDNDNYIINADYILKKDEQILISFEIENAQVEYFVINNERNYDFEVNKNIVTLKVNTNKEWGYENVLIEEVVTDKGSISINKEFLILTLKDQPNIKVNKELLENNYVISLSIDDYDKSIIDIYFEGENVKNMYMQNNEGSLTSGSFYLKYELGDGAIKTLELLSIEATEFDYSFLIDNGDIKIIINESSKINSILIDGDNIYKPIDYNANNIIILLSISISIFIIFLFIGYFTYKRFKCKRTNKI